MYIFMILAYQKVSERSITKITSLYMQSKLKGCINSQLSKNEFFVFDRNQKFIACIIMRKRFKVISLLLRKI